MGILLLQILQWIFKIILFLLLFLLVLIPVLLAVPVRYRFEGKYLEKKPGFKGKITWFFYLVHMKAGYEKELQLQIRVFGIKVFDNVNKMPKRKQRDKEEIKKEKAEVFETVAKEKDQEKEEGIENSVPQTKEEKMTDGIVTKEKKAEDFQMESGEYSFQKEKKFSCEKTKKETTKTAKQKKKVKKTVKRKKKPFFHKIKKTGGKFRGWKKKIEHYLELWKREETQITFQRAKRKLGRAVKAILPRKWIITGQIGFEDPCTTGQFMGVLGAMYPFLGNGIQIVPEFEKEVIRLEAEAKGHICLGSILYHVGTLLWNRHCFKFIRLMIQEFHNSDKEGEEE